MPFSASPDFGRTARLSLNTLSQFHSVGDFYYLLPTRHVVHLNSASKT
ncbi:hypothetical protein RSAG8_09530, partial [Rhizoctonia solani AG-8 WAC10335]